MSGEKAMFSVFGWVSAAAMIMLAAAMIVLAVPAYARPPGPPPGPPPGDMGGPPDHAMLDPVAGKALRAALHKHKQAAFARLLRDELKLDARKVAAVEKTVASFQAERERLQDEIVRHGRAIHLLVGSNTDDAKTYTVAINGMIAAQKAAREHREKMISAVRQHLTPKQQAQVMLGMHRVRREVGDAMRAEREKIMRAQAIKLLGKP